MANSGLTNTTRPRTGSSVTGAVRTVAALSSVVVLFAFLGGGCDDRKPEAFYLVQPAAATQGIDAFDGITIPDGNVRALRASYGLRFWVRLEMDKAAFDAFRAQPLFAEQAFGAGFDPTVMRAGSELPLDWWTPTEGRPVAFNSTIVHARARQILMVEIEPGKRYRVFLYQFNL